MPLSDHEQRILADIEARLREDDPRFADSVGTGTVATHGRRQLRLSALAFVVGFVLLFVGLSAHILWGVLGFALMLGAAYQGLMVAKKMAGARPDAPRTASAGGPLQRYLDSARRRDDDES